MKTIATIALAAGIALSPVIAQAAFQGPAATPDSANNMTVSDVLSLKFDRDYVCMTGNIVNKVITDHEEYTFRDATGSMVVEIEDKVFAGQEVTPETRVRICGESPTSSTQKACRSCARLSAKARRPQQLAGLSALPTVP